MLNSIRPLLAKTFRKTSNKRIIKKWEKANKPLPPPPEVKQHIIAAIQKQFQYRLFIETGTYTGAMVSAQLKNFKQIYSIELSETLFADAVKKFENDKNVSILHGDSGEILIDLIKQINEPAIFWLDGHYSAGITAKGKKECPIYEELNAIFNGKPFDHVLLIDDARLFIGANDYPTQEEIFATIKAHRPNSEMYCKDDIIHVFLKKNSLSA